MYTYFLLANEAEIAQMRLVDDVLTHLEQTEPMVGGNYSLESIASLSKVFLQGEARTPLPTQHSLADESRFYVVDAELCKRMASVAYEGLLNASVPWSEDVPWKNTDVNRMDLAGFILEMAALCRQAGVENSLFMLLSNED
jgi:hypothetical protein